MLIISDEEKGHVIIGEAAVSLIFNREEITLGTLLTELQVMAENEPSDERLIAISAARSWLKAFHQPGTLSREGAVWFAKMQQADSVGFTVPARQPSDQHERARGVRQDKT